MRFSFWSSKAREGAVRLGDGRTFPLARDGEGFFSGEVPEAEHGTRYVFVLDGEELRDPYARFLPEGTGMNARAVVWSRPYAWKHEAPRRALEDYVLYEIHVGTFTPEGTYRAAAEKLGALAELGVTAIELMPLAAFPGERGWGYDGVAHYAPFAPYGTPDDLRAFVDEAHGHGLSVVLDVVYNHLGPAGNVLYAYGAEYFTSAHKTPWGDAPNFGHPAMRRYVVENVRYWLEEFRFDGLRFDAVHAIADDSPKHVLTEIAEVARGKVLFAEDDRNDPAIVTRHGFSAVWADDFHHQVRVALTGEQDGYYAAYTGKAADLAETIENGWFYRGAVYAPHGAPRGRDAKELPRSAFVYCIQNHDQVGNRAVGDRLTETVAPGAFAAATMLLLFLPMTPLLFMGQEWGARSPFLYFTDHDAELGPLITKGRRAEFEKFAAFAGESVPDPQAKDTFEKSRLDWSTREDVSLHRTMLALRRSLPKEVRARAEGDLLVVERGAHRLVVNLGAPCAVPHGEVVLASEPVDGVLPRHAAVLLSRSS